jgi:predicted DNA-binding transcriptional regulator AlpA
MTTNEQWLSIEQTMQYIQCKSKSTVYTMAKEYNIRQTKILSLVYFSRVDIDRTMEENAVAMGVAA